MKKWNCKLIIVAIGMMVLSLLIIAFDDYLIHVKGYLFAGILVAAGYIDIKTRTIPDWIHVLIMLVALIKVDLVDSLIGLVLVPLPFLLMACIKEHSIGGGDVKLVAVCGFLLGFSRAELGSLIGLLLFVISVCLLSLYKNENLKKSYPLVPFLGLGFIIVCLTNIGMV